MVKEISGEEYNKAKDVTRRRLYLETMGEVMPKMGNKYIVEHGQQGYLPILNLNNKKETAK